MVITTGIWNTVPSSEAASMPSMAFQNVFGKAFGGTIVSISLLLFVLSTIIVIVYYCEKQAEALFGLAFSKVIRVVCLAAIIYGAIGKLEFLFALLDILLALVVIPNMIGVIAMRNEIKELKEEFFQTLNTIQVQKIQNLILRKVFLFICIRISECRQSRHSIIFLQNTFNISIRLFFKIFCMFF